MKFANKLFFGTTGVLTIIFAVFGIWMLSSYFNKSLDREIGQADTESRMFQYLFEMAYQSVAEYGEDYAIGNAVESVAASVERSGSHCFAWEQSQNPQTAEMSGIYYASAESTAQWSALCELAKALEGKGSYVCGIRQLDQRYYLLSVCEVLTQEQLVYLGISRDVSALYEDRDTLLNQYRLSLILLVVAGGACVYFLSQYITRPIRNLDIVVGRIAAGDYKQRSRYVSEDEIGKLAAHFNDMADRLTFQMQEKERQAREKESFTAAFAHELKTPLTSIIGYADMLNSIDLSEEERREASYYIYSQGKRLESLSHKLLELVSVEQTDFCVKPVSTKELEENIRATMRPVFMAKGVKGKFVLEKSVIYGDRDLLLSVLYNLLDNAVKAVAEGGFVLLKGSCVEKGYEIKVVDNGCGIPEQEIDRITEAFYMVDKSRSRKEGGAGIGMALCQRIVAIHGGSLRIDSKLGEGTVIRLLFPERLESL